MIFKAHLQNNKSIFIETEEEIQREEKKKKEQGEEEMTAIITMPNFIVAALIRSDT